MQAGGQIVHRHHPVVPSRLRRLPGEGGAEHLRSLAIAGQRDQGIALQALNPGRLGGHLDPLIQVDGAVTVDQRGLKSLRRVACAQPRAPVNLRRGEKRLGPGPVPRQVFALEDGQSGGVVDDGLVEPPAVGVEAGQPAPGIAQIGLRGGPEQGHAGLGPDAEGRLMGLDRFVQAQTVAGPVAEVTQGIGEVVLRHRPGFGVLFRGQVRQGGAIGGHGLCCAPGIAVDRGEVAQRGAEIAVQNGKIGTGRVWPGPVQRRPIGLYGAVEIVAFPGHHGEIGKDIGLNQKRVEAGIGAVGVQNIAIDLAGLDEFFRVPDLLSELNQRGSKILGGCTPPVRRDRPVKPAPDQGAVAVGGGVQGPGPAALCAIVEQGARRLEARFRRHRPALGRTRFDKRLEQFTGIGPPAEGEIPQCGNGCGLARRGALAQGQRDRPQIGPLCPPSRHINQPLDRCEDKQVEGQPVAHDCGLGPVGGIGRGPDTIKTEALGVEVVIIHQRAGLDRLDQHVEQEGQWSGVCTKLEAQSLLLQLGEGDRDKDEQESDRDQDLRAQRAINGQVFAIQADILNRLVLIA